jgi:hypothetical protein
MGAWVLYSVILNGAPRHFLQLHDNFVNMDSGEFDFSSMTSEEVSIYYQSIV